MPQRKDYRGFNRDQVRELGHPVRLRILELARADPQRPLASDKLALEMGDLNVNVSQVAYHVARLRDADLLPGQA